MKCRTLVLSSGLAVVAVLGGGVASSTASASSERPAAVGGSSASVSIVSTSVPTLTAVPRSVSCAGLPVLPPGPADGWATPTGSLSTAPSDYYAIELVSTGRLPGTRLAKGVAFATASASPFFGVALAPNGEYVGDLDIRVEGLKPLETGAYVAWVTNTDVTETVRLGAFDESLQLRGRSEWNKFLVVITREPSADPTDGWQGPVILRGMSRSGRMHTMAGHGPYQTEPCAKYGFQ